MFPPRAAKVHLQRKSELQGEKHGYNIILKQAPKKIEMDIVCATLNTT
jgi:hypothetical protein